MMPVSSRDKMGPLRTARPFSFSTQKTLPDSGGVLLYIDEITESLRLSDRELKGLIV